MDQEMWDALRALAACDFARMRKVCDYTWRKLVDENCIVRIHHGGYHERPHYELLSRGRRLLRD